MHEGALLESQTLRASVAERTEVLDKVKLLAVLPDGLHVTTRMVADYFEVSEHVIGKVVQRHRDELTANGMHTLRGADLERFKRDILSFFPESYPQPRSNLTLYSRRAVLNVAMLLRDSEVARRVRTHLLDSEEAHRAASATPAPSAHEPTVGSGSGDDAAVRGLIAWLDERIARSVAELRRAHPSGHGVDEARVRQLAEEVVRDVVGRTIVPLLNQAIDAPRAEPATLGERSGDDPAPAGSAGAGGGRLDGGAGRMNGRQFEQHVAWLCRRDGCAQVTVTGGHGDAGADVVGYTADGRRLVVQCKARTPSSSVTSGDVQGFIGMAKLEYKADVALLVATAPFTRDALLMAARHDVTAVHRGLLEAWNSGAKLNVLE